MALPRYLAMTAAEMGGNSPLPPHFAYLSCHFSPSGAGLSNFPTRFPQQGILIIDDSLPPREHDPNLVTRQLQFFLQEHPHTSILLDFQRPDDARTSAMAEAIVRALPCPVGVAAPYAAGLDCPVFLPPVPPSVPLPQHIAPWRGRVIWLELALDGEIITVTKDGSHYTPLSSGDFPATTHQDTSLHCHYCTEVTEDQVRFSLYRKEEDLPAFLQEAEALGVQKTFGLYQEFE